MKAALILFQYILSVGHFHINVRSPCRWSSQHLTRRPCVCVCVCLQVLDKRESLHYSAHHPSVRVHGSEPHLPLQYLAGPAHQTEGWTPRRVISPFQHPTPGLFASHLSNLGRPLFVQMSVSTLHLFSHACLVYNITELFDGDFLTYFITWTCSFENFIFSDHFHGIIKCWKQLNYNQHLAT